MNNSNKQQDFQWTDELVAEYSLSTQPLTILEFKRSKQQPIVEDRIVVSNMQYYGERMDKEWYQYKLWLNTDNIPANKYEAVKQAIEECLNPPIPFSQEKFEQGIRKSEEYFRQPQDSKEDKPEWEILSFYYQTRGRSFATKASNGYFFYGTTALGGESEMLKSAWSIHSVKRLSDNQIFSIGDLVGYNDGIAKTKEDWAIDNFFVREHDGKLLARSKGNLNVELIDNCLYKSAPKEEQKPILKTTQEVQYDILMDTPLLSLREIDKYVGKYESNFAFSELVKLANTKINKQWHYYK